MILVMDINGVFDGAAISAASMISRKRTPTDNFVVFYRNCDGVFRAMVCEPVLTAFERFQFFLIRAGRVDDVMIVNIVDDFEVGLGSWADSNSTPIAFRSLCGAFCDRTCSHQSHIWARGHSVGFVSERTHVTQQ